LNRIIEKNVLFRLILTHTALAQFLCVVYLLHSH